MQNVNVVFTAEQLQDAKTYLACVAALTPNPEPTNFEKLVTVKDWADEYFRLLYLSREYVETNRITRAQLRFFTESLMTYVAVGMKRDAEDDDVKSIRFFTALVQSGYVRSRFFVDDADVYVDDSAWDIEPSEHLVQRVKDVVKDTFAGEFETRILQWLVREIDSHSYLHHGIVPMDMIEGEASHWWVKEYVPYLTQMVAALARTKDALDQAVVE